MIIKTKAFQDSCKKILEAVDTSFSSTVTETVELVAKGRTLNLSVTNKEYYVSVKTPLDIETKFHAVVNASLFLNLVSKITTDTIELDVTDNVLNIKANGHYKLPMLYDGDKLVKIPPIVIDNVTNTFNIRNVILQSILKYNAKELLKSGAVTSYHKTFYVDGKGALTFGTGACINSFELEQDIVIALTEKIVKLFKLFKSESVEFSIGFDKIRGRDIVTKVQFKDDVTLLSAILSAKEDLFDKFPIKPIRSYLEHKYKHTVNIDRVAVLETINRLSIFDKRGAGVNYIDASFTNEGLTLRDGNRENSEFIAYINPITTIEGKYSTIFNSSDLKLTLEAFDDQLVNISFGNNKAIIIQKDNITNVLAESSAR